MSLEVEKKNSRNPEVLVNSKTHVPVRQRCQFEDGRSTEKPSGPVVLSAAREAKQPAQPRDSETDKEF